MAAELREDYLESLGELTVASRPIIKTLTEIAQENVEHASAIVEASEQHCVECPPHQKLPALYLIDSICKNVRDPYAALFATKIVKIFTNAFETSLEPTKIKLSEQFRTWTSPNASSGEPLFPQPVLQTINDFLNQQMRNSHLANGAGGLPATPPVRASSQRLTQSGLLVEMNRLRSALERDQGDPFVDKQMQMLNRFQAQVSGVPDPKLLNQIQLELDALRSAFDQHLAWAVNNNRRFGNRRDSRKPNNSVRDSPNLRTRSRGGVDKIPGSMANKPVMTRSRVSSAAKPDQMGINVASELENDFDMVGLEPESPNLPDLPNLPNMPNLPSIANIPIGLTNLLQNQAPLELSLIDASKTDASDSQIAQLYAIGLPLQCSTCGYRFPDSETGRAAKQLEMDWHFRANKDIREGRSRSRCCFLTAVRWIEYRDEDEVFGSGAITDGNDAAPLSNAENSVIYLEKEREKYVEVPMDSNVVCPVCQEPHTTSWSEEAENWVWMNTVEVSGVYFHATCYADPQNQDLVASVLSDRADHK